MSIQYRIENNGGSEVLIINVPGQYDSNVLQRLLGTTARESYQRGSTFRVVVDYGYTLHHITGNGILYKDLKILETIPDNGLEYRAAIVLHPTSTINRWVHVLGSIDDGIRWCVNGSPWANDRM